MHQSDCIDMIDYLLGGLVFLLGWSTGVMETVSSALEIATSKLFIFRVSVYRFDSTLPRLLSNSARSGWHTGIMETANSAFEMVASKSSRFPVRSYRLNKLTLRLSSRFERSGWFI